MVGILVAVAAAHDFLRTNSEIAEAGLAQPLHTLALALTDLLHGKANSLLAKPARVRRGGRPPCPSSDVFRAGVAHILDVLTSEWECKRRDAGQIIAAELRRLGRPTPIATILDCRDEIGGRASALAADVRRQLAAARARKVPGSYARPEAEVQAFLRGWLGLGFLMTAKIPQNPPGSAERFPDLIAGMQNQPEQSPVFEPLLVPTARACAMLGIGRTKFWALVKGGRIDMVDLGGRRWATFASIKALAQPPRRPRILGPNAPALTGHPDAI